jgi:hypothetical protein
MNTTKIFARDIDTIEDQIAALRARLAQLKEVEAYANTAITSVADAIRKIQQVGGESLDKFQDAIAQLFPTKFVEQHITHEEYPDYVIEEAEPEPEIEYLDEPEDDDDEEIITHTSPHKSFEVIKIAESVAYCRNNREDSIQCAYAGFNNKLRAEQWGKHMVDRHIINRFEIRPAQRLEGFKYELKMWNISIDSVKLLAQKDLSRVPGQASFPVVEEVTEEVARESLGLAPKSVNSEQLTVTKKDKTDNLSLGTALTDQQCARYVVTDNCKAVEPAEATAKTEFKQGDWVKYDSQTLQVSEPYSDGTLSLETPEGYLMVHKSEVEAVFKKPDNWHPFSAA